VRSLGGVWGGKRPHIWGKNTKISAKRKTSKNGRRVGEEGVFAREEKEEGGYIYFLVQEEYNQAKGRNIMNENILIQKGQIDDWQSSKNIRLKSLKDEPQSFRNSFEEANLLTDQEWKERIQNPDSLLLFAKIEREIIGMAGINFFGLKKIKHIAKLFEFYVDSDFRGSGIGEMLMESIIAEIEKSSFITKIQLYVNTRCERAINLYKKFGFREVGLLSKELKVDGEYFDEYIMEKMV
jgi:ribosomal protein S18 acetylase RimI-like enzyme